MNYCATKEREGRDEHLPPLPSQNHRGEIGVGSVFALEGERGTLRILAHRHRPENIGGKKGKKKTH